MHAMRDIAVRMAASAPRMAVRAPWAAATGTARGGKRAQRGAALIIVIAIMTILLAIALTFFTTANFEVNNSTNVVNTVRVDLLQESATAIAISMLNQDFLRNPQATSLDHPWNSLPSGAAFAGKPWARFKGIALAENNLNGIRNPGLPEFNFSAVERQVGTLYVQFEDGVVEPLFQGSRSKQWLYVPRFQGPSSATNGLNPLVLYDCVLLTPDISGYDPNNPSTLLDPNALNAQLAAVGFGLYYYDGKDTGACLERVAGEYGYARVDQLPTVTEADVPFITSPLYGRLQVDGGPVFSSLPQYPAEQLDLFNDVDNTGDGMKDSMWLPIPGDLYFTQDALDNNLNGWVDEQQDDGINNDAGNEAGDMLFADALFYQDIGTSSRISEPFNDEDEAIEPAVFVYFAGDDGLDNDGDGLVDADDPDENGSGANRGLFLTAPLPGLSFYVDLNADGVAYDLVPDENEYLRNLTLISGANPTLSDAAVRAQALQVSLVPLRVLLPGQIQVSYSGVFVRLGAQNVDAIDNDYDLVVNDYNAYCYLGPNTLPQPFRPPFETTFDNEGNFSRTFSPDTFNSYLSVFPNAQTGPIWAPAPVPDDYYAQWRAPGNWFQPVPTGSTISLIGDLNQNGSQYRTFAAAKDIVGDLKLYNTPRRKAFTEINTGAFDLNGDGVPDMTFSPRFVRLYSPNSDPNNLQPEIDLGFDLNGSPLLLNAVHVTHSGEPVCEIVGRVALHIADAAASANINVVGGHTLNDEFPIALGGRDPQNPGAGNLENGQFVRASLGDESGPFAFETRMLPEFGEIRSAGLRAGTMGTPGGGYALRGTGPSTAFLGNGTSPFEAGIFPAAGVNYAFDVTFPGYGRADDNGDALLLAMNGKDDDGDGLIDEGLFLPQLSADAAAALFDPSTSTIGAILGATDPADTNYQLQQEIMRYLEYYNRLGNLEGIDEPGEFQVSAALRNLVAERDNTNNDFSANNSSYDTQTDEPGELGDAVYTDTDSEEINTRAFKNGATTLLNALKPYLTTFSTDRSTNFVETAAGAIRAINRIDYNFATPQRIAAALVIKGGFEPLRRQDAFRADTPEFQRAAAYAEGLSKQGIRSRFPDPTPNSAVDGINGGALYTENTAGSGPDLLPATAPPSHIIPSDPLLDAMKLAANIKDATDRDIVPTRLSTERQDGNASIVENQSVVNWPIDTSLNNRERESAKELFPTEEIESYINNVLGLSPLDLQYTDDWWASFVIGATTPTRPEQRHLTYTTTGHEAIVINEIMARPVRRVEAEMVRATYLDSVEFTNTGNVQIYQAGWTNYIGSNPFEPFNDPTGTFFTYNRELDIRNYDPAPAIEVTSPNVEFTDSLPDFSMTRQRLMPHLLSNGYSPVVLPAPVPAINSWNPENAFGPINSQNSRLGEEVAITNRDLIQNRLITRNFVNVAVPDVIQFIVRAPDYSPSPNTGFDPEKGIPPGRYYLTVNTIDPVTGRATVNSGDDIRFAIKYVNESDINIDSVDVQNPNVFDPLTDPTILGDFIRAIDDATDVLTPNPALVSDFLNNNFADIPDAHVAGDFDTSTGGEGRRPGWVFLDGAAPTNGTPLVGYFEDSTGLAFPTHTVTVPEPGTALCIAIYRNSSDNPISINFFDFQQQPDHEYIEIANTADKAVDLTDWKLQIGTPDVGEGLDAITDPNSSTWTVPAGTTIAPGGTLLLGFDVFDGFQMPGGQAYDGVDSLIGHNGMGLASSVGPLPGYGPDVSGVTAPPIGDVSYIGVRTAADFTNMFNPVGRFFDPTGSVFTRGVGGDFRLGGEPVDYVDRNGDGLTSYYLSTPISSVPATLSSDYTEQELFAVDGVTDDTRVENDTVISTVPAISYNNALRQLQGFTPDNLVPNKPWDRLVQLQCVGLRRNNSNSADPASPIYPDGGRRTIYGAVDDVDFIADLVLRGGFLPDYPEHDGIDNDGDGAYFIKDFDCENEPAVSGQNPFVYRYVAGELDKDMIDNDLNGLVDEHGSGLDFDGDGCISDLDDFDTVSAGVQVVYPDIRQSEGVDEGNLFQNAVVGFDGLIDGSGLDRFSRRYGPGSYEPGTLPAVFFRNRNLAPSERDHTLFDPTTVGYVGRYGDVTGISTAYDSLLGPGAPTDASDDNWIVRLGGLESYVTNPGGSFTEAYYLGCDLDAPDWKAFTERRWNPGDNVVVSLYNRDNALMDRATYREYDIINRTIDDVAPCPYYADNDSSDDFSTGDDLLNLFPQNAATAPAGVAAPGYPTFWPPNQMGLDFYRALERKDPDYAGDLFGTSNRWQPTDGAYDDWAESLPFFRGVINESVSNGDARIPSRTSTLVLTFPDPAAGGGVGLAIDRARMLRHCIYGSPLRMNLASRLLRNPADMARLFVSQDPFDQFDDEFPSGAADSFTNGGVNYTSRSFDDERPFGQFATIPTSDQVAFSRQRVVGAAEDTLVLVPNNDWSLYKVAGHDRISHRDFPRNPSKVGEIAGEAILAGSLNEGKLRLKEDGSGEFEEEDLRGANAPMRSAADILRTSFPMIRHDMYNTAEAADLLTNYPTSIPYLHSQDPMGYDFAGQGLYYPFQLAGGVLGRDSVSLSDTKLLDTAISLMPSGSDNVVLTVGQAKFVPIAPAEFEMTNNSASHPLPANTGDYGEVINWLIDASRPDQSVPPAAWAPIYTFALPDDDQTSGSLTPPNRDAFPFYPAYPNGAKSEALVVPRYLLSSNFLFPNGPQGPSYFTGLSRALNAGGVTPASLDNKSLIGVRRMPFEKRVAMYVSAYRGGQADIDRPDAIFSWDQEDGLENGEYAVYIGTFLPGLSQRLNQADSDVSERINNANLAELAAANGPFTTPDANDAANRDPAIRSLLQLEDNTGGRRWNPTMQIELITDRTRAQGVAREDASAAPRPIQEQPGILPPADWQPGVVYTADENGYIFYGDKAEGSWRPITVRVTDNFLALRVRNAGGVNDVAAVSHIVLTPRKRVPGKVNINTTKFAEVTATNGDFLYSTVLGLPGVFNDLRDAPPGDADVTSPRLTIAGGAWRAPGNLEVTPGFVGAAVPPQPRDPSQPDVPANDDMDVANYQGGANDALRTRATQVGSLIETGRTVHPLGRYYEAPGDLVRDDKAFNYLRTEGNVTAPDTRGDDEDGIIERLPLYPLSNNNLNAEARFEETTRRFRRLANAITVRSDVFEIIATVQSGYVLDADGDGRLNYRSPDEFITTAESKGRVVYERRAPSDVTDQSSGN